MKIPQYSGPIEVGKAMMIINARNFLYGAQTQLVKELAKENPRDWVIEGLREAIDDSKEQLEILGE